MASKAVRGWTGSCRKPHGCLWLLLPIAWQCGGSLMTLCRKVALHASYSFGQLVTSKIVVPLIIWKHLASSGLPTGHLQYVERAQHRQAGTEVPSPGATLALKTQRGIPGLVLNLFWQCLWLAGSHLAPPYTTGTNPPGFAPILLQTGVSMPHLQKLDIHRLLQSLKV